MLALVAIIKSKPLFTSLLVSAATDGNGNAGYACDAGNDANARPWPLPVCMLRQPCHQKSAIASVRPHSIINSDQKSF